MMKAIKVVGDELQWEPAEAPAELPEGHVRIDVAWTAINRADLMQRAGAYPPPPGASEILGLEVSGTVAAVGEGVREFNAGDEVCALLTGGGAARGTPGDLYVEPAVDTPPAWWCQLFRYCRSPKACRLKKLRQCRKCSPLPG